MNGPQKIKVRELISRATYKTVKNMNREQMNEWAKALYNDAMRDCEAASMLALALKCSIGDINSAIYDIQNIKPDQKEDEDPSDMVDELEQPAKEEKPEPVLKLKDKAVKRKAEKQRMAKPKLRFTKDNPPPKERWPEDPPEEKKTPPPDYVDAAIYSATQLPDVFGIKKARREAVAEYKQRLKDACLQALAEAPEVIATPETSYSRIGKRVLTELLKDDTEAE